MYSRNRKLKIFGYAAGMGCMMLLSACQPSTQPTQPTAPRFPEQAVPAISNIQKDEPDIVGTLIEQVEEKRLKQEEEVASVAIRPAAPLPVEEERARLAEEALNAALSLLKKKKHQSSVQAKPFKLHEKKDVKLRVGFLLPLSGDFETLGRDIAGGAEMALFQLRDPEIDIVFFDTKGGKQAEKAARQAVASNVDIIVGPLFTASVQKTRSIFAASSVPVLTLSNNIKSASPGNWVLGLSLIHI